MVVNDDSSRFSHDRTTDSARAPSPARSWPRANGTNQCITIGLLNNMAGAAFEATEGQFVSLLDSASEGLPIHVSFYALPGLSRTESGGSHFASHYASVEALLDTRLDGLIVTGREPKMASLRDELYWQSFTQVLEWARDNTHSTIWSCLAAHAAILHMDGIERRKSEEKNFGVFECARDSDHPLTQGLAPHFRVPHSRWNGVAREDLMARGYSILSQVCGKGVDAFVKEEKSLFAFFQGHLEYDSDTLMREYRRDVGRYIKGEISSYPLLPHDYFDRSTEQALTALRDEAVQHRNTELLASVVTAMEKTKIENRWQSSAMRIYRNWLECISTRKGTGKRHAGPEHAVTR